MRAIVLREPGDETVLEMADVAAPALRLRGRAHLLQKQVQPLPHWHASLRRAQKLNLHFLWPGLAVEWREKARERDAQEALIHEQRQRDRQ